ncbi:F-box protein SKP2A-like [Cryptomeria japonica]|uniref:F-box protein SKP2A-like n=1 Tax=Cryptomeria japonica TaxID=3369 RepID=UPI0027DA187D|nr:F-box protein SKP2A-like [Cryptomeria japonica]
MSGKENIKPMIPQQPQALEPMPFTMIKQEKNPVVQNYSVLYNVQIEIEDDATHSKWHDLPMELVVRILVLADDRSIIVSLGVCTGWRDVICVGVQDLSLSWCKRNMSNLVMSIVPRFNCLQSLNLRQNQHQLNKQAIEIVAKHCHDLCAIDLSNNTQLTDKSLEALARGCSLLEKLNMSGCSRVSDHALIFLSEQCNKLRHLNLCGCIRAASDRALLELAHNCCHLQSLNLGWCEMVTNVGVTGLAQCCLELRALDLCGYVLITDQSVIALAGNCHDLRSLGLYYSQNITDTAMYSLVNNATSRDYMESVLNDQEEHGLGHLNISQCTSLSAPAVQAVYNTFPALHTWQK